MGTVTLNKPFTRTESVSKDGFRKLFSVDEAATYLSVAPKTVRNWAGAGRLPRVKLGRSLRFLQEDLDRFVEASRTPQPKALCPYPGETARTGIPENISRVVQFSQKMKNPTDSGVWS